VGEIGKFKFLPLLPFSFFPMRWRPNFVTAYFNLLVLKPPYVPTRAMLLGKCGRGFFFIVLLADFFLAQVL